MLAHPEANVVGATGADKTLYMWAFAWWPHALRAGHNPLDVNVTWMPHGFDFGLGTAGGGLVPLAWPLTWAGGTVLAYNSLRYSHPRSRRRRVGAENSDSSGRAWWASGEGREGRRVDRLAISAASSIRADLRGRDCVKRPLRGTLLLGEFG